MSEGVLRELRIWIQALELSKYEVAIAGFIFMVVLKIRPILTCFVELRAIERNFELKKRKLESQIQREQKKRAGRKSKGK